MRKYYLNANMILRKFSNCSLDVKYCMFESYCATMYCSFMWFDSTVTPMKNKENCSQQRPLEVTKLAKLELCL